MLSLCEEPLRLTEAGLRGLCVSLNTPVLNVADLPVGPARAAVVLHDAGDGVLEVGVGVYSIETRQVAVYASRGAAGGEGEALRALERAARFGEQMGFLFDESEIDPADPNAAARALDRWYEVAGGAALSDASEGEPASEVCETDGELELLLDEPVAAESEPFGPPPEEEIWLSELTEPGPVLEEAPAPSIPLAKFRRAPSPPSADRGAGCSEPAPAGALGRIALVRRAGESRRPSPLLRLLGNF